jgi:protein gp37
VGDTKIQWATKSWNPTRGCRRVSPGCEHCYAEKQAYRHSGPGRPYEGLVELGRQGPRWTGEARFLDKKLREPLSWPAGQRVFVNSMSDLFFEEFTNEEIAAVFGVMGACPQHDFLVLTKRPARARAWFRWIGEAWGKNLVTGQASRIETDPITSIQIQAGRRVDLPARQVGAGAFARWPLPNVWLGVSVEDQRRADERIPTLLELPAAVRFVSAEPLLGRVNICQVPDPKTRPMEFSARYTPLGDLDWVIVGGESGPGARPMDLAWARLLVSTCREANVPCFVKQLGADPLMEPGPTSWPCTDPKGGDPDEWPKDLRVRQFPRTQRLNASGEVASSVDAEKEEERVLAKSGLEASRNPETPEIPGR